MWTYQNHYVWIDVLEYLNNIMLKRSCKSIIIRFRHTLPIEYGDLYSINFFNDKPIVISSSRRQGKIGWNLHLLKHL
jgi:hypothetical protein